VTTVNGLLACPTKLPSLAAAREEARTAAYWRRMDAIRETLIPRVRAAVVAKIRAERKLIDLAIRQGAVLLVGESVEGSIGLSAALSDPDEILVDFAPLLNEANKVSGFKRRINGAFQTAAKSFTAKVRGVLQMEHPGFGPMEQAWIDGRTTKIVDQMDRTTQIALNRKIRLGLERGWTKDELREEVRQTYDGWMRSRPEFIARTETGIIAGKMQDDMVRAGPIPTSRLDKIWITARDDRVRDSHEALEGVRIPYDEVFVNGLRYPHDENGAASEVINCRCVIMMEEAVGR